MPEIKTKTATTNSKPKKTTTKKATEKKATKSVLYPKVEATICEGKEPITVSRAKELLGWTVENKAGDLGDDFHPEITALVGYKVNTANNNKNRPFYRANCEALAQEILKQHWRLNGEPIIIGETGQILNGQHTLVALILAGIIWKEHREDFPQWKAEPTLDKIIVTGIKEEEGIINTMDTCKPRSLADVIYRSPYFSKLSGKDRKQAARMMDYAVRLLWERTGAYTDAHSHFRTHSESIDFINRHQSLTRCVRHIFEEDSEKGISKYIGAGYAAGLLYLMAAGKSDLKKYNDNPEEKYCDLSLLSEAEEFFTLLAQQDRKLREVHDALVANINDDGGSFKERQAILIKAWTLYHSGESITAEALELRYHTDSDGIKHLAECPIAGGIDVGTVIHDRDLDSDDDSNTDEEQKSTTKKQESKKPTKHQKMRTGFDVGDEVWVIGAPGEENWQGEIVGFKGGMAQIKRSNGYKGAGNTYEIPMARITHEIG